MRKLLALTVAVSLLSAPLSARQKFITGVFMGTENGNPIELIAWAQMLSSGSLRMENSSLEDAPTQPRTYRFLVNMGSYDIISVLAVNQGIFSQPLDRLERITLPFSKVRLAVTTYEVGIPELEDWPKVLRLRKSLKATADKPLMFFLVMSNGAHTRYYPFFIDQP